MPEGTTEPARLGALRPGDLHCRADIDALLVAFYSVAMTDDLLGPVFAAAHLDLHTHLPRIGDFWERTLLGSGSYDGQPMVVHRDLHQLVPLTPSLFDRWLELWTEAVDACAGGPIAERAKATAGRVAQAVQGQLSKADLRTSLTLQRPA
jgi:hemoglobin